MAKLYLRMHEVRWSMRVLRHVRYKGIQCWEDGKLRPNQQGVRRRLLSFSIADVYGQPVCNTGLQNVRRYLRCMCQEMRATRCWPLQKMCRNVSSLRRRVQKGDWLDNETERQPWSYVSGQTLVRGHQSQDLQCPHEIKKLPYPLFICVSTLLRYLVVRDICGLHGFQVSVSYQHINQLRNPIRPLGTDTRHLGR